MNAPLRRRTPSLKIDQDTLTHIVTQVKDGINLINDAMTELRDGKDFIPVPLSLYDNASVTISHESGKFRKVKHPKGATYRIALARQGKREPLIFIGARDTDQTMYPENFVEFSLKDLDLLENSSLLTDAIITVYNRLNSIDDELPDIERGEEWGSWSFTGLVRGSGFRYYSQ